ncbi:YbdD/YjiX family protein [Sphingobium sp.]|uniref:YbdD/YjiX family protein n=1 Tax=Sphingobium sp. TaxID=1912891 RepID=UPI002D16F0D4|nr:YbdD/YjiX family protein [Sphingobium sp.]HUD90552.1 YbdD/YjiX family protein [Sphingobium sp.]
MSGLFDTLRRTARLMVGMPDYDAYLRHMADHHADMPVMDRTQFFRDRQEARYGGKNGGRCC